MKIELVVCFDDGFHEGDNTPSIAQDVINETRKQLGRSYGTALVSIDCHRHALRWERGQ